MASPVTLFDQSGTGILHSAGNVNIPVFSNPNNVCYVGLPWSGTLTSGQVGYNIQNLNYSNKPMVVVVCYAYPSPNDPITTPVSATFGGNAMTLLARANGHGSGLQPDREISVWVLPMTTSTVISTTLYGNVNYAKFQVTWPVSVTHNYAFMCDMFIAQNVDPVATVAAAAYASYFPSTGLSPQVMTFPSANAGVVNDMLMSTMSWGNYGNVMSPADDCALTIPASGYSTIAVGADPLGTSTSQFTTAYKTLSGAESDTYTWQVPPSYPAAAFWLGMYWVLKAVSGGGGGGFPSVISTPSYIVQPGNLPFVQWASKMNNSLNAKGDSLIVSDERKWKEWASKIVTSQAISFLSPPNPTPYTDWRAWARDLIRTLSLSGF